MTAEDFTAWLALMKTARGWSSMKCGRELGCDKNSVKRWRESGAPLFIALACHAIAYGLGPWKLVATIYVEEDAE